MNRNTSEGILRRKISCLEIRKTNVGSQPVSPYQT